jgi:hypothetical protein
MRNDLATANNVPVFGLKYTALVADTKGVWFEPAAFTPTMYDVCDDVVFVALIAVDGPIGPIGPMGP